MSYADECEWYNTGPTYNDKMVCARLIQIADVIIDNQIVLQYDYFH